MIKKFGAVVSFVVCSALGAVGSGNNPGDGLLSDDKQASTASAASPEPSSATSSVQQEKVVSSFRNLRRFDPPMRHLADLAQSVLFTIEAEFKSLGRTAGLQIKAYVFYRDGKLQPQTNFDVGRNAKTLCWSRHRFPMWNWWTHDETKQLDAGQYWDVPFLTEDELAKMTWGDVLAEIEASALSFPRPKKHKDCKIECAMNVTMTCKSLHPCASKESFLLPRVKYLTVRGGHFPSLDHLGCPDLAHAYFVDPKDKKVPMGSPSLCVLSSDYVQCSQRGLLSLQSPQSYAYSADIGRAVRARKIKLMGSLFLCQYAGPRMMGYCEFCKKKPVLGYGVLPISFISPLMWTPLPLAPSNNKEAAPQVPRLHFLERSDGHESGLYIKPEQCEPDAEQNPREAFSFVPPELWENIASFCRDPFTYMNLMQALSPYVTLPKRVQNVRPVQLTHKTDVSSWNKRETVTIFLDWLTEAPSSPSSWKKLWLREDFLRIKNRVMAQNKLFVWGLPSHSPEDKAALESNWNGGADLSKLPLPVGAHAMVVEQTLRLRPIFGDEDLKRWYAQLEAFRIQNPKRLGYTRLTLINGDLCRSWAYEHSMNFTFYQEESFLLSSWKDPMTGVIEKMVAGICGVEIWPTWRVLASKGCVHPTNSFNFARFTLRKNLQDYALNKTVYKSLDGYIGAIVFDQFFSNLEEGAVFGSAQSSAPAASTIAPGVPAEDNLDVDARINSEVAQVANHPGVDARADPDIAYPVDPEGDPEAGPCV